MEGRATPAKPVERWRQSIEEFTPEMQGLLVELLMYKSILASDWLRSLAAQESDPELADTLIALINQTTVEGDSTLETARAWEQIAAPETLKRVGDVARRRLVEDITVVKEGNVEVLVAAAMAAPTQELRTALLRLADVDRQLADSLRGYLGAERTRDLLDRRLGADGQAALGAHDGRIPGKTLRESVETALKRLKSQGGQASRLVLSAAAVRHLRDEGAITPDVPAAFGLPVDIDFGWEGECFAFTTSDRIGLAEILTAESQHV